MTDYTKTTNFTAKDSLLTGDPDKLIKGSLFDTEFDNIVTAITSKFDTNDIASTVQVQAEASSSTLVTPERLAEWSDDNAGIVGELRDLADPGADRIFFWDDGEVADSNVAFLTVTNGLEISTTSLQMASTAAGDGLAYSAGVLSVNADQGVKIESDTVRLSDVSAGATQPVVVTDGTFTFDLTSVTELAAEGVTQAQDKIVVSNNGTINVMPWDQMGLPVVSTAANQNFALTDVNTIQRNTGTGITWTIDPDATTDLEIGAMILLVNHHASGALTITAGTGVTLYSVHNAAGTTATSDSVDVGGSAVLFKTGNDQWQLTGDITD